MVYPDPEPPEAAEDDPSSDLWSSNLTRGLGVNNAGVANKLLGGGPRGDGVLAAVAAS